MALAPCAAKSWRASVEMSVVFISGSLTGNPEAMQVARQDLARHGSRQPIAVFPLRQLDDPLATHHLRHDPDHLLRLLHALLDVLRGVDLLGLSERGGAGEPGPRTGGNQRSEQRERGLRGGTALRGVHRRLLLLRSLAG